MGRRTLALAAAAAALLVLPASAQATAPWACIGGPGWYMAPVEGQAHTLDASCSGDADDYDYDDGRDIELFEWDLDGDGIYETRTGTSPIVTHTWSDRSAFLDAELQVGLRVTDAQGEQSSTRLHVWIIDAVNSWFEFDPELTNPGDTITFDAYPRRKAPPAPQITYTYEWDLDGDGSYEHATGTTPEASYVVPDAFGKRTVGLRVTDSLGNVSRIRREVEALPRHPSRDLVPWDAPPNLGATVVAPTAPGEVPLTVPGPAADGTEPAGARTPRQPRLPRLVALDGNRNGMSVRYVDGPKWSRWRLVVRLPADRAASYGLPRKTVVFARGTLIFNGRGVGTAKMRWTKGAYRVFRRVRHSLLDIRGRRIA